MSPYDQQVYDAGFKYIPRSEFLLNPFQIPQGGGATAPTQPGLPSINIGGGGGGFNPYNADMSQIRTDFRPDYDFRRYSEYGMDPSTMVRYILEHLIHNHLILLVSWLRHKENIMNFKMLLIVCQLIRRLDNDKQNTKKI